VSSMPSSADPYFGAHEFPHGDPHRHAHGLADAPAHESKSSGKG
jgi:hypothetical protein